MRVPGRGNPRLTGRMTPEAGAHEDDDGREGGSDDHSRRDPSRPPIRGVSRTDGVGRIWPVAAGLSVGGPVDAVA